ncbi:hypothetical protein KG086_12415 [Lacticaseibacillus chiayiensis]|uniref:hypothetical protein n=1 Tax=Lacticaseibacillus chiayiensis TaxID=2100821 RepID=UPI001BCDA38A|nr:hypothetical protein [Lacticaseibacillus chiayiensis]QVI34555.1 hypothetical protein KG086_12415 [Lacticaseibacillus chiayiensis]
MTKITLQLMNDTSVLAEACADDKTYLAYQSQYALGNYYRVRIRNAPAYVWVQLDASLAPSLIYMNQPTWDFKIPFNTQREWPYPDGAFLGKRHYAWVRLANEDELTVSRNLALNTYDQHEETTAYPHISANAETRNETVFYAKNAIDGVIANEKHGSYPFQSWGIAGRADAELMLDFGRPVDLNQLILILRADYPHDSYWTDATVTFSNGNVQQLSLAKTANPQAFDLSAKHITWLKLTHLVKAPDSSSFPALTQLEAWGKEAFL